MRSGHLVQDIPFLRLWGVEMRELWGVLGRNQSRSQAECLSELPIRKGQTKREKEIRRSREKPHETRQFEAEDGGGAKRSFQWTLWSTAKALISWIRRDKEGEGTVNGSNSDSLPISFSISALPRAKSKDYGIHYPGSQQNLQG